VQIIAVSRRRSVLIGTLATCGCQFRLDVMVGRVRRYLIEIKNASTGDIVLFTTVDWTDDEKRHAVGKVVRLAGLPDDGSPFESPADPPGGRGRK
ncbi:MAG: hypothetical protein ACREUF_10145, partial [Solimonas sp.]